MFGIYSWFYQNTLAHPEKTALVTDTERISYNSLSQRINRLAWGLRQQGVGTGTHVGILFANSRQFVEAYYALQKLGAFEILVNYRFQPSEIFDVISDT